MVLYPILSSPWSCRYPILSYHGILSSLSWSCLCILSSSSHGPISSPILSMVLPFLVLPMYPVLFYHGPGSSPIPRSYSRSYPLHDGHWNLVLSSLLSPLSSLLSPPKTLTTKLTTDDTLFSLPLLCWSLFLLFLLSPILSEN